MILGLRGALTVPMLAALAAGAATGCFKKGDGKGTRQQRPDFINAGTIFDDGPRNQQPEDPTPTDTEGEMDPDARKILAACFKLDEEEVATVVGWTDAKASADAATALCAQIAKTGYKDGISNTADPVEID